MEGNYIAAGLCILGWLCFGVWQGKLYSKMRADRDRWRHAAEANAAECARMQAAQHHAERVAEWLADIMADDNNCICDCCDRLMSCPTAHMENEDEAEEYVRQCILHAADEAVQEAKP